MEFSYILTPIVVVAAFAVFAFLAFRMSRNAKVEGGTEAGGSGAGHGSLCHECLGASNLDKHRMSECAYACGVMPE